MKYSLKMTGVAAALALTVTGCTASGSLDRDDKLAIGAVGGAVVGGLLGYELFGSGSGQLIGLAVGAAGGAVGGYYLADRMTQADKRAMESSAYDALTNKAPGEGVSWVNPDSGNSGNVVSTRTFMAADGRLCRDYKTTVNVSGETVETVQTACRTDQGDWIVT